MKCATTATEKTTDNRNYFWMQLSPCLFLGQKDPVHLKPIKNMPS